MVRKLKAKAGRASVSTKRIKPATRSKAMPANAAFLHANANAAFKRFGVQRAGRVSGQLADETKKNTGAVAQRVGPKPSGSSAGPSARAFDRANVNASFKRTVGAPGGMKPISGFRPGGVADGLIKPKPISGFRPGGIVDQPRTKPLPGIRPGGIVDQPGTVRGTIKRLPAERG